MNASDQQEYFNLLHDLIDIKDDIRSSRKSVEEGEGQIKKGITELSEKLYAQNFRVNLSFFFGRELFSFHFIKSQIEKILSYYIFEHGMQKDEFVTFYGTELLNNIQNPHEYIFITRMGNFPISTEYVCKSFRILPNNNENINSLISEFSILSDKSDWLEKKLTLQQENYRAIIVIKSVAIDAVGFFHISQSGELTGPSYHDDIQIYDYPYLIDYATTILKKFKCICNFIQEQPIFFEGINFSISPSHFIMEVPSPMMISYSRDTPSIRVNFDLLSHYKNRHKDVFNAIENIVKKGNMRTSFENKKLQAVYWFGEAIDESEIHHKLLKNIIALESLFLDIKIKEKGDKLGLRASLVSQSDRNTMRHINRTISQAYRIRNNIIHNGIIALESPSIVYDLIDCSRYVLKQIILNPAINSYDDIVNLENNQKNLLNSCN